MLKIIRQKEVLKASILQLDTYKRSRLSVGSPADFSVVLIDFRRLQMHGEVCLHGFDCETGACISFRVTESIIDLILHGITEFYA